MKIWILSDLHIDDFEDWQERIDLGPHPDHDVIVMAGDLTDGDRNPVPWLLEEFSDAERERMLFVPGNHEFNGLQQPIEERLQMLREQCGIKTLNRDVIEFGGRRFVGCTMWSSVAERLDDIVDGPAWRAAHRRDAAWLDDTVVVGDIVITHHAPHREGLSAEMQHKIRLMHLASAYYTDMSNLFAERVPALWIHGHTHVTREYEVHGCPVVSNGRGRGHAPHFRPDYVYELPEPVPRWSR